MFLNKLNFPALPVSTEPWSTKAPLNLKDEHGMEGVHGGGAQLGWEMWWRPCPEDEKGSGLVPQGAQTVGWFTPSCSHLEFPFPPSVSPFWLSLHEGFGV